MQRAAQALIDASNTISQVEDRVLESRRRLAQRRDPRRGAERGDRSAAEQRPARAARRGCARRRGRVADAGLELSTTTSTRRCRTVSQLQVQLKSLIVADPADPIWTANLVPSTSVQELPTRAISIRIVTQGRLNRPEVRQAEDKRLSADIDRAFAQNQSLPQADLQVQYLSNGFAGVLTPVPSVPVGRMRQR